MPAIKNRKLKIAALLPLLLLPACESTPVPPSATTDVRENAMALQDVLADFRDQDPTIDQKIGDAYAYVIFPNVISGALVFGGAHGSGYVFQKQTLIGYADVSQGTIGAQIGSQSYAEILLLQNADALQKFTTNHTLFDARSSLIAYPGGIATTNNNEGAIALTLPRLGLMAQAAVGSQKFRYAPMDPTTNSPLPPS